MNRNEGILDLKRLFQIISLRHNDDTLWTKSYINFPLIKVLGDIIDIKNCINDKSKVSEVIKLITGGNIDKSLDYEAYFNLKTNKLISH